MVVNKDALRKLVQEEDIKNLADLSRLKTVQPWDKKRIAKYQRALDFLCEIHKEEL